MGVIARPLIVVAGATAVGKSQLALALARALNGEVVSLDSVAVYRGLDIGSAKPSVSVRACVAHHLLDVIDPNEQINAARFIKLAEAAITDIQSRNKTAVIVGGSTMYLTALLYGLADLPASQEELRLQLSQISTTELYAELLQRDPLRARVLHPNDRIRIERAIEIARGLKQSPSERIIQHGNRDLRHSALCFCLCLKRKELYARIDARVAAMLASGLVAETRQVLERYGIKSPGLGAIGYAEVVQMISQQISEDELAAKIAQSTRRYAKRQLTYWRNEPQKRSWNVEPPQNWPSVGGGKVVFPDFRTDMADLESLVSQASKFLEVDAVRVDIRYLDAAARINM